MSPLRRFTRGAFRSVVVLRRSDFLRPQQQQQQRLVSVKAEIPLISQQQQQQQHPFKHQCYSGRITTSSPGLTTPHWDVGVVQRRGLESRCSGRPLRCVFSSVTGRARGGDG